MLGLANFLSVQDAGDLGGLSTAGLAEHRQQDDATSWVGLIARVAVGTFDRLTAR
jgi:hypothetical protein